MKKWLIKEKITFTFFVNKFSEAIGEDGMVTIKDVAERAKVSTATVSRVINSPQVVSEKRREAVLEAIKALNYHPNDIARSLLKNETKLIGVIVPDITNVFSTDVIAGISAGLQQNGYAMSLAISHNDSEKEIKLVDMMLEKRVSGIIMLGPRRMSHSAENEEFLNSAARSLPIVIIDFTTNSNMYCIRMDEAAGIHDAVKYLYDLGHRRIGFVNGPKNLISYHYKDLGYRQAMQELDLGDIADDLSVEVSDDYAGGAKGANILLCSEQVPTAIVSGGDKMAMGIYYALHSMGKKVPEDISIIGFSGSTASGYTYPPMTTVDQKPFMMGEMAAETMMAILSGKSDVDRNVIIKPGLLIRESCGPIGLKR